MSAVVLLTDFGLTDHYTGVLHAVLARDAPGADRIDLTHQVPPGDIWGAVFRLRCAWSWLADDVVVLAVVDPGVGTPRRAVAARVGTRWVVAPDNGLPTGAGAVAEAVELDAAAMGLPRPSATFHGRDLFAPAAARLARGDAAGTLGRALDPASLVPSPLPEMERIGDRWRGRVLHVDRFGNVVTNLAAAELPDDVHVVAGDAVFDVRVTTYGEAPPDEVVMLEGSSGYLELAVGGGSAAEITGLERGDHLETSG